MDENKKKSRQYSKNAHEEETQREGRKGGESYFITWYEFESEKKENDENERK